jgi:hypothetical protein
MLRKAPQKNLSDFSERFFRFVSPHNQAHHNNQAMKLRVNNYPFNNRERLTDFLGVVYSFRKL